MKKLMLWFLFLWMIGILGLPLVLMMAAKAEDAFNDGAPPIVVTPPITVAPQIVITPQITILPPTVVINPPQVKAAPRAIVPPAALVPRPRIRHYKYQYYDDCCDSYMTNLSVPADRVLRGTVNCNGVGCY